MTTTRCALSSRDADEPIAGTALDDVRYWIAVEDRATWGRAAFEHAPEAVRQRLDAWAATLGRTRLQALRRRTVDDHQPVAMLLADAALGHLWSLSASSVQALMDLDVPAIFAGLQHAEARSDHPILLVCTHGHRDVCCAKDGVPAYNALRATGVEVWQTSHLGGHRFAANVVCLPTGLSYGRVQPDEAEPLVAALRRGTIFELDRVRGSSLHPAYAQAAELALRRRLRLEQLGALTLDACDETGDKTWRCTFLVDGAQHHVHVTAARHHVPVLKSCDADGPALPKRYLVVEP